MGTKCVPNRATDPKADNKQCNFKNNFFPALATAENLAGNICTGVDNNDKSNVPTKGCLCVPAGDKVCKVEEDYTVTNPSCFLCTSQDLSQVAPYFNNPNLSLSLYSLSTALTTQTLSTNNKSQAPTYLSNCSGYLSCLQDACDAPPTSCLFSTSGKLSTK